MQPLPLMRSAILCGLMVATAVGSVLAVPVKLLADTRPRFILESAVPRSFDGWQVDPSMVPLPPSPDQQSVLNKIYDQILSRTYVNSHGERIMLSITYGSRQTQQMRAHRQEVCYSAQGFKIAGLDRSTVRLAGGPIKATRMVATQGQRVEPVTYWFTMGDEVVLSYLDRESTQFRYALRGFIPDGYLVRISSLSTDPETAFRQHVGFANGLLSGLDGELKRRLIGRT